MILKSANGGKSRQVLQSGTLDIDSFEITLSKNVSIIGSKGSAIVATSSHINVLEDTVLRFVNNSATDGGAMALLGYSVLELHSNSQLSSSPIMPVNVVVQCMPLHLINLSSYSHIDVSFHIIPVSILASGTLLSHFLITRRGMVMLSSLTLSFSVQNTLVILKRMSKQLSAGNLSNIYNKIQGVQWVHMLWHAIISCLAFSHLFHKIRLKMRMSYCTHIQTMHITHGRRNHRGTGARAP